jgi:hypothetical protein
LSEVHITAQMPDKKYLVTGQSNRGFPATEVVAKDPASARHAVACEWLGYLVGWSIAKFINRKV